MLLITELKLVSTFVLAVVSKWRIRKAVVFDTSSGQPLACQKAKRNVSRG